MDEYRVCTDRYKEHLSSILDSDYNDDKKHAFEFIAVAAMVPKFVWYSYLKCLPKRQR